MMTDDAAAIMTSETTLIQTFVSFEEDDNKLEEGDDIQS